MQRAFIENPTALHDLIMFVIDRLPEKHLKEFEVLAWRARDSSCASDIESTIAITDGANRYNRLKEEYEKVVDVVGQISKTCFEHRFEMVRPHFRSLGRIFHEFHAPFPTRDELRANFYKELAERLKPNQQEFCHADAESTAA
jgi:hypothetical protein